MSSWRIVKRLLNFAEFETILIISKNLYGEMVDTSGNIAHCRKTSRFES